MIDLLKVCKFCFKFVAVVHMHTLLFLFNKIVCEIDLERRGDLL